MIVIVRPYKLLMYFYAQFVSLFKVLNNNLMMVQTRTKTSNQALIITELR